MVTRGTQDTLWPMPVAAPVQWATPALRIDMYRHRKANTCGVCWDYAEIASGDSGDRGMGT